MMRLTVEAAFGYAVTNPSPTWTDISGRVHINTAYFAWTPELDIVWLSEPRARHSRNIRANDSAAITVYDSAQTWGHTDCGIQLFGRARELEPSRAGRFEAQYAARFPDAQEPLEVQVLSTSQHGPVTVLELTYRGAAGNSPVRATLVRPAAEGKGRVGLLWVHWLGEPATTNRTEFLDEAIQLASSGVVSLLVDTLWSALATTPLPVPAPWLSTLLRHACHATNPRLDLATWGEIFGVLHLDTVYDPCETFRLLAIDPAQYSREKTLQPLIQRALQCSRS